MTLVDKAIEFQKENRRLAHHGERPDYDQVWCVFDGGDKHPNVPKALGSAKENGIRVAVSVPCFEVWQLLHLQELTTRPLTRQEAKQLLRRKYLPKYGKDITVFPYELVSGKSRKAIERAKILHKEHKGHGGEPNPSSDVSRLVQEILKNGVARRLRTAYSGR